VDGKSYRRVPQKPSPPPRESLRERQDRLQRERERQERNVDLSTIRARLLNAQGPVTLNRAEARRAGAAIPETRQLDLDVNPLIELNLGEPGLRNLDIDDDLGNPAGA
jgi:hypothetical protein